MATLTPEAQEIFGRTYNVPDELWLYVFFSPTETRQAAGRAFLKRFRARKENRALAGGAPASRVPSASDVGAKTIPYDHRSIRWPSATTSPLTVMARPSSETEQCRMGTSRWQSVSRRPPASVFGPVENMKLP
jgi:hypothetical protein